MYSSLDLSQRERVISLDSGMETSYDHLDIPLSPIKEALSLEIALAQLHFPLSTSFNDFLLVDENDHPQGAQIEIENSGDVSETSDDGESVASSEIDQYDIKSINAQDALGCESEGHRQRHVTFIERATIREFNDDESTNAIAHGLQSTKTHLESKVDTLHAKIRKERRNRKEFTSNFGNMIDELRMELYARKEFERKLSKEIGELRKTFDRFKERYFDHLDHPSFRPTEPYVHPTEPPPVPPVQPSKTTKRRNILIRAFTRLSRKS